MNRTPKLPARIQRRNAQFQQWQALLTNRRKRSRSGQMLIQGVRPLSQALEHGVELIALLADDRPQRSRWARDILERAPAPKIGRASCRERVWDAGGGGGWHGTAR